MGNIKNPILLAAFSLMIFTGSFAHAQDERDTGGTSCSAWCWSRYQNDTAKYRKCILQTEAENARGLKCGGGSKLSGAGSARTQPQQQNQAQQPQNNNSDPLGDFIKAQRQCQEVCQDGTCEGQGDGTFVCKPKSQSSVDSAAVDNCGYNFQKVLTECQMQSDKAQASCDSAQNSEMNSVSDTASQVALMLGQQAASSITAACSKMATLSQAANAALAGYRSSCGASIESGKSSCSEAISYIQQNGNSCVTAGMPSAHVSAFLDEAKKAYDATTTLTSKMEEAGQAMRNYANTAANATQCNNQTSASVPDLCALYPNSPGCNNGVVDCNNPSMATNKVCVCAKTPSDPMCVSAKSGGGSMNGGTTDFSSRLGDGSSGNGLDSLTGDIPGLGIEQGKANKSAANSVDGKQGGGAGIGGGDDGGGGIGGGGGGGHGAEDPLQVNAGFYGGGAGGGGAYGGGLPGSGGGAGGGYGAGGVGAKPGGPDLRAFLPGGKFAPGQRGLAGAAGADGITGPHSNIWQKIQNRYQSMSPTLLP